jgi:hypothetical protein
MMFETGLVQFTYVYYTSHSTSRVLMIRFHLNDHTYYSRFNCLRVATDECHNHKQWQVHKSRVIYGEPSSAQCSSPDDIKDVTGLVGIYLRIALNTIPSLEYVLMLYS